MSQSTILSGNSNIKLAEQIAGLLGLPLGKAKVARYSDGEIRVHIEEAVRGHNIFIIQSTSNPCNDHLMELLLMTDALRRASAKHIAAVIPYFGYARQDKRQHSKRVPISARVVADLLSTVGIDRVITVDLHAEQLQGFFSMPVDNLYASKILLEDMEQHYASRQQNNIVIISPDIGGVVRARAYAKHLHTNLAIIDKRRPKPNESEVMHLIGDVKDQICIIVDDLVDTAGTICHAATALKENGAKKVLAYCTHAVLSGDAIPIIEKSDLDELVVTDTISLTEAAQKSSKIRIVSIASLLSNTIKLYR